MTSEAFHHILLPLMGAGGLTVVMVVGVGWLARRDGRKSWR